MSKPITSKRFLELCTEWGIKTIATHTNWASHNRNTKGEWNDLHGVMLHHTGKFTSVNQMAELLWNGYAALPGPLCQSGIDPAGILRLTGWGRANHAGLGSESTLERVIASNYPKTGNIKPGPPTIDGNARFYGFEIMADGITPITDAQRITAVRITAAICLEHNWGPDVIGHGEWQQGKWDVGAHGKLIDFSVIRNEVKQAMKEGPPKKKPPTPTKPPAPKPTPVPTALYTIRTGDTLMGIAEEKFGDPKRWTDIVAANPSLLKTLIPGQKLTLPGK